MEFKSQRNQDLRSKILKKKEPQRGETDIRPEFTWVILWFPSYLLDKNEKSSGRSYWNSKNLSLACCNLPVLERQELEFGACHEKGPGEHSGFHLRPQETYFLGVRANQK